MTDVKRLLDEATPLPWTVQHDEDWKTDDVFGADGVPVIGEEYDTERAAPNAALIVAVVNKAPDYEAAVDALDVLIRSTERLTSYRGNDALDDARAAHHRLRGES
jgi:hypothetical protein